MRTHRLCTSLAVPVAGNAFAHWQNKKIIISGIPCRKQIICVRHAAPPPTTNYKHSHVICPFARRPQSIRPHIAMTFRAIAVTLRSLQRICMTGTIVTFEQMVNVNGVDAQ